MILDFIINFEECIFLILPQSIFSFILLYSGYCAFRSAIKGFCSKYPLNDGLLHIYDEDVS
jgi:hypothetical protein